MQNKTHAPSRPSIEILEARVAPAGIVTVTFAGGVLTLDGDGADNVIDMSPFGADGYLLSDGGGTQFAFNGAAATSSALIVGAIKSINAKLGGGNDTIGINLVTAGSIAVDGGDGNDTVNLIQPDVSGPFTFKGGIGNDTVNFGGPYALIGGNVSIDLGDGTNTANLGASDLQIKGSLTVLGGTGVDSFIVSGSSTAIGSGITAKLGGDANNITMVPNVLNVKGNILLEHLTHASVVTNNIGAINSTIIGGSVTINNGDGGSNTNISGSARVQVKGAVKVTSGNGVDNFSAGGAEIFFGGGLAIDSGDGNSTTSFSSAFLNAKSIATKGGANSDILSFNTLNLRTGAITVLGGNGANSTTINGNDISISGPVKVLTGAGDDGFTLTANAHALVKGGIFVDAGDGANAFSASGPSVETSALAVKFGAHASGTSAATINTGAFTAKTVSMTSLGGTEQFGIAGILTIGSLTISAGDGANSANISGPAIVLGAFSYTGGAGDDIISTSIASATFKGININSGAGNNSTTLSGSALTVNGPVTVAGGAAGDALSIIATSTMLAGGIKFTAGDGASILNIAVSGDLTSGPISYLAGDAGGSSNQLSASIQGNATIASLATAFTAGPGGINFSGTAATIPGGIKIKGGSGSDNAFFNILGNFNTGAISAEMGDGSNSINIVSSIPKIASITYLGGSGDDTVVVNAALGSIGSAKIDAKAGNHTINVVGAGLGKLGSLTVNASDVGGNASTINIDSLIVTGNTSITTGAANTTFVMLNSVFGGTFSLDLGAGNDAANLETFSNGIVSVFKGGVTIDLGDGDDGLNIGANTASGKADFRSSVKILGGTGADTANISAANFGNIYIAGQPVLTDVETQN